jgi:hypothetical protein
VVQAIPELVTPENVVMRNTVAALKSATKTLVVLLNAKQNAKKSRKSAKVVATKKLLILRYMKVYRNADVAEWQTQKSQKLPR